MIAFFSYPLIFQCKSMQIPFFLLYIDEKMKDFHLFAKLCKITPNFYLILSNEVTVGANRKFFTLSLNGLKAIPANKSNYGGK